MKKNKCVVLFSGGLDSRLAVKIMKEKNFEVFAVFFKFPFLEGDEKSSLDFLRNEKVKTEVIDCTRGKFLQEYLRVIKKAEHGCGKGTNPCIDCRIFMLKKAKKFADSLGIRLVVTGEVLNQRPMSQRKSGLEITRKKSGLGDRLFRPLAEQNIKGKKRDKQIALAKNFRIDFPYPSGGCLLCEKSLKRKLKFLLERGLNEEEIKLVKIGRHFIVKKSWVILGRNEKENEVLQKAGVGDLLIPKFIGPVALVLDKPDEKTLKKVGALMKAYSKQGNLKKREKLERDYNVQKL